MPRLYSFYSGALRAVTSVVCVQFDIQAASGALRVVTSVVCVQFDIQNSSGALRTVTLLFVYSLTSRQRV